MVITKPLNGVADGARTHDNRNHNPGLYQLSYSHHRDLEINFVLTHGASWRSRTFAPQLRRLLLYPTELRTPCRWLQATHKPVVSTEAYDNDLNLPCQQFVKLFSNLATSTPQNSIEIPFIACFRLWYWSRHKLNATNFLPLHPLYSHELLPFATLPGLFINKAMAKGASLMVWE